MNEISNREQDAEVVSYVVCSRWNLEKDPTKYMSWHIYKKIFLK